MAIITYLLPYNLPQQTNGYFSDLQNGGGSRRSRDRCYHDLRQRVREIKGVTLGREIKGVTLGRFNRSYTPSCSRVAAASTAVHFCSVLWIVQMNMLVSKKLGSINPHQLADFLLIIASVQK